MMSRPIREIPGTKRLLLLLVAILVPLSALAESPNAVVEEAATLLHQAIEGRRDELREDKAALYALIDDILLPRFDRRYSAQLVLARHWRTASDKQRERFIKAFYYEMMRIYAEAVLEFDLARLEVLPFRGDATKKRVTVKTAMQLDDGTMVPVNYGMVSRESGWMMFDVTIEGISYVRNFKAELNTEIQVEAGPVGSDIRHPYGRGGKTDDRNHVRRKEPELRDASHISDGGEKGLRPFIGLGANLPNPLVPPEGLEPPLPCEKQILSLFSYQSPRYAELRNWLY